MRKALTCFFHLCGMIFKSILFQLNSGSLHFKFHVFPATLMGQALGAIGTIRSLALHLYQNAGEGTQ